MFRISLDHFICAVQGGDGFGCLSTIGMKLTSRNNRYNKENQDENKTPAITQSHVK